MSFKYKFSVITTTYNRVNKIHRVYNSLLSQTLQKENDKIIYEWILIDDGSSDETKKIVKEWQKESKFCIKYVYQENSGKLIALRKGIDLASGEYILIVDSDDGFKPQTFKVFSTILKQKIKDNEQPFSISCLCENQYGEYVGDNFPIANDFALDIVSNFQWNFNKIGDRWGVIPAVNLKKYFILPKEIEQLKFIPESFFWNKMVLKMSQNKTKTYYINDRLLICYKNENNNLSTNARLKHSKGFEYESLYFINNYLIFQLFHSPKFFIKHLLKYMWASSQNGKNIISSIKHIDNKYSKVLFVLFLPFLPFKKIYFRKDSHNE